MFTNIKEVEVFLQSREKYGIKPGLDRVTAMLAYAKHPEKESKGIHIAGTNGKGSTIHLLKNALIANGYTVGLFTSPSFTGLSGHFLINNRPILVKDLLEGMNTLKHAIDELDKVENHPTAFEIMTVLAFIYFKHKVDFLLVETGMGGKEDTTNCFTPLISVITNISLDHVQFLGNTITEITTHKAGIIKQQVPVITGSLLAESKEVITRKAMLNQAPLFIKDDAYESKIVAPNTFEFLVKGKTIATFTLQMEGMYQLENAAIAAKVLFVLKQKGYRVDWEQVQQSFKQTILPGRFEVIHEQPKIIVDSAHNEAGVAAFLQTVANKYQEDDKVLLFAGFKDKQLMKMIKQLESSFTKVILTTFDHERAAPMSYYSSFTDDSTYQLAANWRQVVTNMTSAKEEQIFFVTGSLHFITLVRDYVKNNRNMFPSSRQ